MRYGAWPKIKTPSVADNDCLYPNISLENNHEAILTELTFMEANSSTKRDERALLFLSDSFQDSTATTTSALPFDEASPLRWEGSSATEKSSLIRGASVVVPLVYEAVSRDDIEAINYGNVKGKDLSQKTESINLDEIDALDDDSLLGRVRLDDIEGIDYNDPDLKILEPRLHGFVSDRLYRMGIFRSLDLHVLSPIAWSPRYAPRSTTTPSESVPSLTEGTSKCSNTSHISLELSQPAYCLFPLEQRATILPIYDWDDIKGVSPAGKASNFAHNDDTTEDNASTSYLNSENENSQLTEPVNLVIPSRVSSPECNLIQSR